MVHRDMAPRAVALQPAFETPRLRKRHALCYPADVMAYVMTERPAIGTVTPRWSGWLAAGGLLLGAVLTFKDDVLLVMRATLEWAQQAESIRLFIANNWRHYRATLTPSDMGFDAVEVFGMLLMGVGLVVMLSRAASRSSSHRRDPVATGTAPNPAANSLN